MSATSQPGGLVVIPSPLSGTVVTVEVSDGDLVSAGQELVVLEAMKMHHAVRAPVSGLVWNVRVAIGELVNDGQLLMRIQPSAAGLLAEVQPPEPDQEEIRADLAEVIRRHAIGGDEARAEAVAKRRASGQRTARENIADLCDDGTFVEYGPLVIAAQRQRRSLDELVERTPADGLVAGIGTVSSVPCVVLSYDYTVLAGTQGLLSHRKTDRMLDLAARRRLPVVFFTEGGGGRPGDTDTTTISGLDVTTFHRMGRLSGLVPLVGIVSGRCFAGNAALLGCCDVIIATANTTIGMGGPAMIEGGGLGAYPPEEIGPASIQVPAGVVDVLVADEAEAVAVARRYLSYVRPSHPQQPAADRSCADQRLLRQAVPEDRLRVYDIRAVVAGLCDAGSVLELRAGFGVGIITALVRIEGTAMGLIANNPGHLGGAIDADAADKAARFLQLCDAFGLPIVSLCDTPGFMVGPDAERTGTVRHFSRLFVTGANLTVPMVTVVLRKAYGLGAQAMAGGSFAAPMATVAWPTGEIGAMGLEGAVKLGFRRELDASTGPDERQRLLEQLITLAYERGKAMNVASVFEIDDVIDPADTRRWICTTLAAPVAPPQAAAVGKRRPYIDTW